jgi:membrane fusion protein
LGATRQAQSPVVVAGPRQALFRAESLQEQRTLWLGRQTISLGTPSALVSVASMIVLSATALLVFFGTYAGRATLHGIMLPSAGLIQVTAPAPGRVETMHVNDGATVSPGTRLYTLNTDLAIRDGSVQQRILNSLTAQREILLSEVDRRKQIENQENAQLQQKMKNLQNQIQQMQVQIGIKTTFVNRLAQEFADYTHFLKKGIGNLNEKNIQQQNWMRSEDELEELKSRSLRFEGDRIDTQTRLEMLPLRSSNEIDDLKSKISEIDQQVANAEAKHAIEIVSPVVGKVTAIAARPGQDLQTGGRMLTIVPDNDRLQAELLAPSTSVGFIRTGERVLLRYAAFPYQKFGSYWGTVTDISRATLQPQELKTFVPTIPVADQSKTFYKVVVIPDSPDVVAYGRKQTVEVSMQVDAGVLLDRRPIYEWILEPLFTMRGL